MERLKSNHEDEMLRLKDRHQRELERQDGVNQSEKDAEQIAKQREAERRKNESVELDEKSSLVAPVELIFDVIVKEIKKENGFRIQKKFRERIEFCKQYCKNSWYESN